MNHPVAIPDRILQLLHYYSNDNFVVFLWQSGRISLLTMEERHERLYPIIFIQPAEVSRKLRKEISHPYPQIEALIKCNTP